MTDLLNQYSKETGRDIKITPYYYDGIELIEKYDPTIDLIFLDIQNEGGGRTSCCRAYPANGRNRGHYFSHYSYTVHGLEGYKYHATNYIIKPMKYAPAQIRNGQIRGVQPERRYPSLVITNDTGKYKVPLKSIRYVGNI